MSDNEKNDRRAELLHAIKDADAPVVLWRRTGVVAKMLTRPSHPRALVTLGWGMRSGGDYERTARAFAHECVPLRRENGPAGRRSPQEGTGGTHKSYREVARYVKRARVSLMKWNRCAYCGKFISLNDFGTGKAGSKMVTPDSEFTTENIIYYHVACKKEDLLKKRGALMEKENG